MGQTSKRERELRRVRASISGDQYVLFVIHPPRSTLEKSKINLFFQIASGGGELPPIFGKSSKIRPKPPPAKGLTNYKFELLEMCLKVLLPP